MRITAQQVIDALKNDFEVRSYSGRVMYGANCVGVDTDDRGAQMKIAVALIDAGIDADDVVDLAADVRTDSMGLGQIVYFPNLRLTDEEHQRLLDSEDESDQCDECGYYDGAHLPNCSSK